MIQSKQDYRHYVEMDAKALGITKRTDVFLVLNWIAPNYIWKFQKLLRKKEYYLNCKKGIVNKMFYYYLKIKHRKLALRLGFSIPENVFGPGLAIIHSGTIIVNSKARIGANCRIHACTNIGASGGVKKAPQIGDNVYIGPGAKIYGDIKIGNNIAIAANAAVGKSFEEDNIVIGGVPARKIKSIDIRQIIKHI